MPQNSLLQHKTWYCICGHKGTFASCHDFEQLECCYQWICIWHFLTTLNARFGQLHLRKSGNSDVTWPDIKYSTYCGGCLSYRPYVMFLLTVNANKGSYVELTRGIYDEHTYFMQCIVLHLYVLTFLFWRLYILTSLGPNLTLILTLTSYRLVGTKRRLNRKESQLYCIEVPFIDNHVTTNWKYKTRKTSKILKDG